MDLFEATHGWGEIKKDRLPKTCIRYPAMMELGIVISYLKKIRKINESRDTPLESYFLLYIEPFDNI